MDKKGITKFWIEIIGGVIVVVVILVILISVATTIGTAATDVENSQEMDVLINGFSGILLKASLGGGEHPISPFTFNGPASGQVYAMVLVTPAAALKMTGPTHEGLGSILANKNKQEDLYKLQKCATENDMCMCLFRLKYITPCSEFSGNLIVTSPNYGSYKTANPTLNYGPEEFAWWDEFGSVDEWNLNKFITLNSAVNDVAVVSCKLLSAENSCSTAFGEKNLKPCIPHYDGMPMVWLSTKNGGALNVETLSIQTFPYGSNLLSYYPAITKFDFMPDALSGIGKQVGKKPCAYCGGC
jgi:hypothetical protein